MVDRAISPSFENAQIHEDIFVCDRAETRTYKRRYWMIFLYGSLSTLCSMTFLLYTSIANQTGCYYVVSQNAVNWTTEVFPMVYLLFVVPACFLMDYLDIRRTLILSSFLQTSAFIVQFFTTKPGEFVFVMISCSLNAVSSLFSLGYAPYIAARWFPKYEVSRACVIGLFGIQCGVGFGALFPLLFIPSGCVMKDKIEDGKRNMAYVFTIISAIILILLIFTFQNKPPVPPNIDNMRGKEMSIKQTYRAISKILKNYNFILVFILIGLNGGVVYAFTTIANDLIIKFFPGKEFEISVMNTLFSCMGFAGSLCSGYILDYTHRFKETTIFYILMSLLFFLMFYGVLYLKKLWLQFISVCLFGFFQVGFLSVGLEYGIEVIFPESEMISSNLEFWSIQLFGVVMIQIVSRLLDSFGEVYSNSAITVTLLISLFISAFLTTDYKRSKGTQEDQRNVVNISTL